MNQESSEIKQQVWKYGVRVHGVKNRCRKPDWHYTDKDELGKGQEAMSEADAKIAAINWIKANMKKVTQAYATAKLWTVDGIFENWEPFNKEHNLQWDITRDVTNVPL